VGQGDVDISCGQAVLYYQIPEGLSEVCGEKILRQTLTNGHHLTHKHTVQQLLPFCNGFWFRSISY
jgi:hypothetical protein